MSKKSISLFLAAVLLALPLSAAAQKSMRAPLLQLFEEQGGKVDFIGTAFGLDGWMITDNKGKVQTVYSTKEGAVIASGMLFAPDGESETKKQLEAYHKRTKGSQEAAPNADQSSSKSEKLYALAEKAGWAAVGNKDAPYLYMFMNVSCDHCHIFWKDIENAVKAGKVQVRLIPYGKTDENRDGGAALLSADDPQAAWDTYLSGDKSVLSKDKVKDGAYDKVDANTKLAGEWKLGGPPFTLYRRPGDGTLSAIVGRPDNVMLLLAEFIK